MVPLPKILWNFSPYFYKYEVPARKSIRRMKQICQEIIKSFEDKHRKSTAAGETARDMKSMLVALVGSEFSRGFARSPPDLRRLIRSGRELPRSPSLRGCIYLFFKKTINIFITPFFFFLKN